MLRKIVTKIPNTITCLNLLSGAVACILSFMYADQLGALKAYEWAFICIGVAAVFDFCDGAAARLLHAYSDMGKELDSLADLISFGLAPTLLMYNTSVYFNGAITWWAFTSLFIVAMGALRLARFNIDDRQTTSFIGLPIPANAIFWIGFVAWVWRYGYSNLSALISVVLVSLLMVSNLRMFSLKFKNFDWRENFRRYVILLAAVLFVVTTGIPGLMWTIILYILISAVCRKEA